MNFVPAIHPPDTPTPLSWCLAFHGSQLLLPDGEPKRLQPERLDEFSARAAARHYLGRLGDHDAWALAIADPPPGWRPVGLRQAMLALPEPLMALAGRAAQVLEWDRTHRHCGVCATPTVLQAHERARKCPACGHAAYPRSSPAMMTLVWRGRGSAAELLLARAPHFAPGMFSALAGFVEPGESLEECIHREVAEEVGVRVRDLRYYGSQSWPFPHSLMVAFTAEWAGGELVRQEDEIEAAAWFPIDALPTIPPRFSISGHLIRDTAAALASR
jgi:NAD+ diphosphatase